MLPVAPATPEPDSGDRLASSAIQRMTRGPGSSPLGGSEYGWGYVVIADGAPSESWGVRLLAAVATGQVAISIPPVGGHDSQDCRSIDQGNRAAAEILDL